MGGERREYYYCGGETMVKKINKITLRRFRGGKAYRELYLWLLTCENNNIFIHYYINLNCAIWKIWKCCECKRSSCLTTEISDLCCQCRCKQENHDTITKCFLCSLRGEVQNE